VTGFRRASGFRQVIIPVNLAKNILGNAREIEEKRGDIILWKDFLIFGLQQQHAGSIRP
jgi:hypothetical protein